MAKNSKFHNEKLKGLTAAYRYYLFCKNIRQPIRMVKLKVDNTQEFHLHPNALTKIISEVVKDPIWKERLIKYHINFSKQD